MADDREAIRSIAFALGEVLIKEAKGRDAWDNGIEDVYCDDEEDYASVYGGVKGVSLCIDGRISLEVLARAAIKIVREHNIVENRRDAPAA